MSAAVEGAAAPAPPPAEVVDVLGRVRPVVRTYVGGEWECPFCRYGVDPSRPCPGRLGGYAADCSGAAHCQNPACFANVHYPIDRAREDLAAAERREREEARRKRDREAAAQRAEDDRHAREARVEAIRNEARERGACVRCAMHDTYRVKFVKHRGPCPRERR